MPKKASNFSRIYLVVIGQNFSGLLGEERVSLPEVPDLSADGGQEGDGDEGQGHDVEEGGLRGLHQEQRNERCDQAEGVD